MTLMRKVTPAQAEEIAPNRTRVTASTNQLARDGHIVEPAGLKTENFLRTASILFDHDPAVPVATPIAAQLNEQGNLTVDVEWAPEGVDDNADRIRGLVKSGVIRAVSIGFDPLDVEPLDPKKPRGGQHILSADLLELSFVTVPADTGAIVTQRKADDWKCGASRDLPIEDSDSWDGPEAEKSIFEAAGGDDFDPSKARKGFLAYNAAKPKERGSYKLPIAHVVDGRLKVPKGAIRAAASRLPQTEIPDDVKDSARKVLDHYEEKAGMKEDRGLKAKHTRALKDAPRVPHFKRGLCEVANLAFLLHNLGYAHDASVYETALEGDGSDLPEMLGKALQAAGEALVAMAAEEVHELLEAADASPDEDVGDAPEADRSYIAAGKTPRIRAWRTGIVMARAGKVLSATNEKHLERAMKHQERALKHHAALGEQQEAAADHLDDAQEAHEKARKAHAELGEAISSAAQEPSEAAEHLERAQKLHKTVADHQEDVAEAHGELDDAQEDAEDSHESLGRSVKAAHRSVKAVVDGSIPGAENGDSKQVQTSTGLGESGGSANGRSLDSRRRRLRLLELAATH